GASYIEVDIEAWEDPRGRLTRITGCSTVPQIVVGDTPVGGYDDLAALDKSGRLEDLLTAAA
ncbi:MAG: glutaredoxin domain-containing protein, partial [Acidimicrobiia bacterium]